MVNTVPPTVCLWDFDSAKVRDYQLQPLVRRIREHVTSEIGRNAEKSFLVCCDVRKLPVSTTRALNKIRNLDIVHVDNSHTGTSEEKIKQKLHQVDIDFRDEPGIIVLISGNGEFGYFLSNMSRSGWKVVLFHHGKVAKELLECVDHHHNFEEMVAEIEEDSTIDRPRSESKTETAYILVTNLPKKMDADRVVISLQTATDEFSGRVCYFNQLTGESVLIYRALESEAKGTTALFLSKSCKSVLGLDLSVLAIKDPCGELSRMKFTVQQLGEVRPPVSQTTSRASSIEQPTTRSSEISTLSNPTSSTRSHHSTNGHAHTNGHPPQEKPEVTSDDESTPTNRTRISESSTVVRDYASAVKKSPGSRSHGIPAFRHDRYEEYENVAPDDDGAIVTNGYRPFFQKPAMQCFHWDNPTHISQSLRDCKFWHPRERCRFYPQCMMGAESCGYAHPFCGMYCECDPELRDPQKNHRLKAPAHSNGRNNVDTD